MKKYIVPISLIFVALFGLNSCKTTEKELVAEEVHQVESKTVEFTKAQFDHSKITFGSVQNKNMSATLAVNGKLYVPPQNLVTVSPLMGGFIRSTKLQAGAFVKKGEVIATLQNPDFIQIQSAYLENKSKLVFLRSEYKRQEELSNENVAATKIFQQISSDLASLEATNSGLEEQLKMLSINPSSLTKDNIRSTIYLYAPVTGSVTNVGVNIGKFVHPQDVICEIIDTGHLLVESTVFEKDIAKIKKGQKIRFVIMNEGDKERTATITLINHQIAEDRSLKVYAALDKADENLMPNMYVKAFIEISEANVSVLPSEAIVLAGEQKLIFVASKGHYHDTSTTEKMFEFTPIEVETGVSQLEFTEVIFPEGFDSKNAKIVVTGAYDLLAKMNNSEEDEGHEH